MIAVRVRKGDDGFVTVHGGAEEVARRSCRRAIRAWMEASLDLMVDQFTDQGILFVALQHEEACDLDENCRCLDL